MLAFSTSWINNQFNRIYLKFKTQIMKKLYKLTSLMIFGMLIQFSMFAQVNCYDMVYISLSPWDGTATLNADMFVENDAQYDQLLIDVTEVDCDDIDTPVEVNIFAILDNDTTTCMSLAIVEDKSPPVAIVNQGVIVALDENGEVTITPETLDEGTWDNCGEFTMSVDPSSFTCADLGQDNTVTLTATDASGNFNSAFTSIMLIQNTGPLACEANLTINTDDGPILIEIDDVLDSSIEGCMENYTLVITDTNDEVVPDNIIWSTYAGTSLTATVETSEGNNCWGTIIVEGDANCDEFTEDNIIWPGDLSIAILGVDSDSLSPASLIEFFDVDPADAMPTLVDFVCPNLIAITYSDNVFIINNFSFQVARNWTILDWTTNTTFTYVQQIDNIPNTDYICDILPRTAPADDCDSGHTLEDDVEWPADLFIEDYRITPAELIEFSGVDPLDAEPSFYNAPDAYTADYVDYLFELGPNEITIGREWNVERSDVPGAFWVYTQEIVVNIESFSNLVTVETIMNRPVPDVQLTQTIITDEDGNATVEDNDLLSPYLSDDPKNGLDIVDLFIMRQDILGINNMNDLQVIAADVDQNSAVTTLDLVLVERVILGIDTELSSEWWFADKPNSIGLAPKAQYIAIKPGDVNDSALLGENNFSQDGDITYKDQLINAGEIIKVPFFVTEEMMSYGMELSFTIDNAALEVDEILSPYFGNSVTYSQNENGVLNVVIMDKDSGEPQEINTEQALFQITFQALQNTVISWSFNLNENRSSFSIDENQDLVLFGEVVVGEIISGLDDLEELKGVSVYPNPASDIINIESSDNILSEGFILNMVNSAGQLVLSSNRATQLDVSNLSPGMYYYTIVQADKLAKGKIIIAR